MNDDKFLVPGVGNPDNAMTNNTDAEKNFAIMENNLNRVSDSYFDARPKLDRDTHQSSFAAGFKRAWDIAIEQGKRIENKECEQILIANAWSPTCLKIAALIRSRINHDR